MLTLKNNFVNLLEKRVTRKEFLGLLLTLIVTVLGLGRLGKLFGPPERKEGFGSGPYGR